ncbi:MAG TPA: hypothetical protein VFR58_04450 [Flavisolibacter sp.]|nr:hypothetical protein [Flavisolibacter sp.]
MNTNNNVISLEEAKKTGRRRFVRSLEYELIASLAIQQHTRTGEVCYEQLLSIPLNERIPGLVAGYGLKRMHQLVKTVLQEFCHSVDLPRSKKLTETRISVVACDLILAGGEDQLALEDLIVFFELAKTGKWGKFKGSLTHYGIMEKLMFFRQERHEAYQRISREKQELMKELAPQERLCPEPTPIKELFETAGAKIVPFKKIG